MKFWSEVEDILNDVSSSAACSEVASLRDYVRYCSDKDLSAFRVAVIDADIEDACIFVDALHAAGSAGEEDIVWDMGSIPQKVCANGTYVCPSFGGGDMHRLSFDVLAGTVCAVLVVHRDSGRELKPHAQDMLARICSLFPHASESILLLLYSDERGEQGLVQMDVQGVSLSGVMLEDPGALSAEEVAQIGQWLEARTLWRCKAMSHAKYLLQRIENAEGDERDCLVRELSKLKQTRSSLLKGLYKLWRDECKPGLIKAWKHCFACEENVENYM